MRIVLFILLGLALVPRAQAASLAQLARETLATHPDVQAAQAAIEATEAFKRQQEAAFAPRLTAEGDLRQSWMKQTFSRTAVSLQGTLTLWQPAAQARIEAAGAQVQDKTARLQQMRQHLLQTLVTAWSQWQLSAALRHSWQSEKQVLQAIRDQSSQLYQVGRLSLAELNLLDARIASIDSRLAQLEGQMAAQQAVIEALSGHTVQLQETPAHIEQMTLPPRAMMDQAPMLVALRAQVQAAEAHARAASQRWQGRLQLYAVGVNNDSGSHFYDDMRGASIGLRFEAPLYRGGADQAAAEQDRMEAQRVRQQMAGVRRQLLAQRQQAAARLKAARAQLKALTAALQANRLSEAALSADLHSGRASLIAVLESARAREKLVRQQATARWQGWRAVVTLWAQWGVLTPEKLASL